MIDLRRWMNWNAIWPLAGAVTLVLALQFAYLGYVTRSQYAAAISRIDRLVEMASLGLEQSNRPVIESALAASLNDSDVVQVALCRGGRAEIVYPSSSLDPCRPDHKGLMSWTLTRNAIGISGCRFKFVINVWRTFGSLSLMLGIAGILSVLVVVILRRARRRFELEILQPLYQGLNEHAPLRISELEQLRREVTENHTLKSKQAVAEALIELSAQVAHDIRAPLAVLEAASADMSGIPEETRHLIRGAAMEMNDITNSLLTKHVKSPSASVSNESVVLVPDVPAPQLLSSLLASLASEKRVQYKSSGRAVIELRTAAEAYGLFGNVQPTEFKRVLSNLVNNAVEALPNSGGTVYLDLIEKDGYALVGVHDNGKGIPKEFLSRLGARGSSHGKPGGSGLGLFHARASAQRWGGRLEINSVVDKGTTVTLAIPLAPPPAWFLSALLCRAGQTVVVLDDDTSVHQVWQKRLGALGSNGRGIELVHVFNPKDLRDWVASNDAKAADALFLLDFHLLQHSETGLDLAAALRLTDRAILVTNAHDDPAVMRLCTDLHMRLLPKSLTRIVPVQIQDAADGAADLLDAVLVDDNKLVQDTWSRAARRCSKKLRVFSTAGELLVEIDKIDIRSPIYLDSYLDERTRGEIVARDLHARGFRNLYLATGHSPNTFGDMPWIKEIVGKHAPWRA